LFLYGSGLRTIEAVRLRVKDIDYQRNGVGNMSFRLGISPLIRARASLVAITWPLASLTKLSKRRYLLIETNLFE
jgi:integrase